MTGLLAIRAFSNGDGGAMTVSINNVTSARRGSSPNGLVTTVQLPNTAVTGNIGTITVVWENVGGSTESSISDETALNPTWSAFVADGVPDISNWRITVTDSMGNVNTAENTVTLVWVEIGSYESNS